MSKPPRSSDEFGLPAWVDRRVALAAAALVVMVALVIGVRALLPGEPKPIAAPGVCALVDQRMVNDIAGERITRFVLDRSGIICDGFFSGPGARTVKLVIARDGGKQLFDRYEPGDPIDTPFDEAKWARKVALIARAGNDVITLQLLGFQEPEAERRADTVRLADAAVKRLRRGGA